MNPVVRHFLPSVVRGVYRADEEFSKIEDAQSFARFIETKFRFLPPRIAGKFRHHVSFSGDLQMARRQLTFAADLFESGNTSAQRAKKFFL